MKRLATFVLLLITLGTVGLIGVVPASADEPQTGWAFVVPPGSTVFFGSFDIYGAPEAPYRTYWVQAWEDGYGSHVRVFEERYLIDGDRVLENLNSRFDQASGEDVWIWVRDDMFIARLQAQLPKFGAIDIIMGSDAAVNSFVPTTGCESYLAHYELVSSSGQLADYPGVAFDGSIGGEPIDGAFCRTYGFNVSGYSVATPIWTVSEGGE